MPASFAVDAFPRRSFTGDIRQIRKSPQNVQNVVSYTVVISAANPDLALLPGMTANVRVQVDSRASALKVPNAALRWRPPGAAAEPAPQDGAPPGKGQGGQAAAQFRERLMKELKPSDAQKAQLEGILAESRRRFATLRDLSGIERFDFRLREPRVEIDCRARQHVAIGALADEFRVDARIEQDGRELVDELLQRLPVPDRKRRRRVAHERRECRGRKARREFVVAVVVMDAVRKPHAL